MFLDSKWWEYCMIAILIFLGCLFVNYILRKVNEARTEERLSRILQKTSISVQVQEPSFEIEANKIRLSRANIHKNSPIASGISLVFNKEDNKRFDIKTRSNLIRAKNNKSWSLEEILEALEISQDDRNALYDKISIISIKKNKSNQIAMDNKAKILGGIVIKETREDCTYNNEKTKEILANKIGSGSLKCLNSDRKENISMNYASDETRLSNTDKITVESLSQKMFTNSFYSKPNSGNDKQSIYTEATLPKIEEVLSQTTTSNSLTTHKLGPKTGKANLNTISTNTSIDYMIGIFKESSTQHIENEIDSETAINNTLQKHKAELKTIKSSPTNIIQYSMEQSINSFAKSSSETKLSFNDAKEMVNVSDTDMDSGSIIYRDPKEISNTSTNCQYIIIDTHKNRKIVRSITEDLINSTPTSSTESKIEKSSQLFKGTISKNQDRIETSIKKTKENNKLSLKRITNYNLTDDSSYAK